MPLYVLEVSPISRAKGARITRYAAYRAGEYIRDERTKEAYDFSSRNDVVYKEIILPSRFARDPTVSWARDRSTLWNAVESTNLCNARLGREVYVVLPPELTAVQRTELVRRYSQELADRYQSAVDAAIHLPRPRADARHHHAHMLMTSREITPRGMGCRVACDLSGLERYTRGLCSYRDDFMFFRERWGELMNDALRSAGSAARVDHRGLRARGIDREPEPRIPLQIRNLERKSGVPSKAGNEIRRRHRERVAARLKGSEELARVVQRQREEAVREIRERKKQREAAPKKVAWASLTKEERAARRRQWYLANREANIHRCREWREKNAASLPGRRRRAYLKAKTPTEQQSVQRWLQRRQSAYADRKPERTHDQNHDLSL